MAPYISFCRVLQVICALALLTAWALPAQAQSVDGGSLYSRFGLGELRSFNSSRAAALGGGGYALFNGVFQTRSGVRSLNYVNFGNPATWGYQDLVHIAASARVDGLQITDADDNSDRLTSGSLTSMQFGLPLLADKLGLAFAFEPYSRVGYNVQSIGQLVEEPLEQDSVLYQINYEGSGGLQQIRGGAGYRIVDGLSLGASIDVIFGIIEESHRTIFDDANLLGTNVSTSTRLLAISGTLGALFRQSLGENSGLSLAASVRLPSSFDANRALTLGESLDRDTLGTVIEGKVDLPMSVRAGGAFQADNRWTLVADALYEPWSEFSSDLPFPGFQPGGSNHFQDRLRVSGGVELLPAGNDQLEPYVQRIAYRLGFYYDQAYVTPTAGTSITSMAATGGLSLPSVFPGTRLDVGLEVGTRGTTDQGLVRDMFYGVSATLNIGERWFVKRKLR